MGIKVTDIGMGVKIIEPDRFYDYRGYYSEIFSARTMLQNGLDISFVQENEALCLKKGTIRGIHFQNAPKAQTKLLRCAKGSVFDVAVDLRKGSPTFGEYVSIILKEGDGKQILIPKGFGHVCQSLEDNTIIVYKVDELWEPPFERAINFKDPDIAIKWPLDEFVVSPKDENAPSLKNCDIHF